jgi:hypothetical protein
MVVILVAVFLLGLSRSEVALDTTKTLSKIAFGSCYGAHMRENPTIINAISDYRPDLFIWLGDV